MSFYLNINYKQYFYYQAILLFAIALLPANVFSQAITYFPQLTYLEVDEEKETQWRAENQYTRCNVYQILYKGGIENFGEFEVRLFDKEGKITNIDRKKIPMSTVYYPAQTEFVYDESGILTEEKLLNKKGKHQGSITHSKNPEERSTSALTANEKGNQTKKEEIILDSIGRVIQRIDCLKLYSNSFEAIAHSKEFRKKDCTSTYYTYDEKGRIEQTTEFGGATFVPFFGTVAKQDIRSTTYHIYDDNDHLIETRTVPSHGGSLTKKELFEYYPSGKLKSKQLYNHLGLQFTYNYEYNDIGMMNKLEIIKGAKKVFRVYKYEYYDAGILKSLMEYRKKDKLFAKFNFEYVKG